MQQLGYVIFIVNILEYFLETNKELISFKLERNWN